MTHNTTDKKQKTLYVSDMDGTLLTSEARLSDDTVAMLNKLIDEDNILFTVATAPTHASHSSQLTGSASRQRAFYHNGRRCMVGQPKKMLHAH